MTSTTPALSATDGTCRSTTDDEMPAPAPGAIGSTTVWAAPRSPMGVATTSAASLAGQLGATLDPVHPGRNDEGDARGEGEGLGEVAEAPGTADAAAVIGDAPAGLELRTQLGQLVARHHRRRTGARLAGLTCERAHASVEEVGLLAADAIPQRLEAAPPRDPRAHLPA